MAKFSAVIAALVANESTQALGKELMQLGGLVDMEVSEVATQFKKFSDVSKENETLKLSSSGLELANKKLLVERGLAERGKLFGFLPEAVKTTLGLIDYRKLDMSNLENGLNAEFFDGLKKEHGCLFGDPAAIAARAGQPAPGAIPAMPPAGSAAPSQPKLDIPGAMGGFLQALKM